MRAFHQQAHNVLMENIAKALFFESKTNLEFIAGPERCFEAHVELCHYHVDAAFVEVGEFDAEGSNEAASAVFVVVLINCIVHDALDVAFVVAHHHGEGKNRLHILEAMK